jgi:hypothetical protein
MAASLRLLGLLVAVVAVGLGIRAALGGHSESKKNGGLVGNITVAAEAEASSNVRGAEIALEAWRADHGTYAGATIDGLHRYDYGVRNVQILNATSDSYCLESRVRNVVASEQGPGGNIVPVACSA